MTSAAKAALFFPFLFSAAGSSAYLDTSYDNLSLGVALKSLINIP